MKMNCDDIRQSVTAMEELLDDFRIAACGSTLATTLRQYVNALDLDTAIACMNIVARFCDIMEEIKYE